MCLVRATGRGGEHRRADAVSCKQEEGSVGAFAEGVATADEQKRQY